MRALLLVLFVVTVAGCAETVRCPEGRIFADGGACVSIPDAGPPPRDAGGRDGG